MKRILSCFILSIITILQLSAYVKHYTVNDGLPTNEVWQLVQLPNKQILVQSTGPFCLFDYNFACVILSLPLLYF